MMEEKKSDDRSKERKEISVFGRHGKSARRTTYLGLKGIRRGSRRKDVESDSFWGGEVVLLLLLFVNEGQTLGGPRTLTAKGEKSFALWMSKALASED